MFDYRSYREYRRRVLLAKWAMSLCALAGVVLVILR